MSRVARRKSRDAGRKTRRPVWVDLTDEELLQWRLCDLGLRIRGTPLERRIDRLYRELERGGIRFRPHVWLASEWFSPDGGPGIAVPFYLAHPRLARLEGRQMLEVEGGNARSSMRILRHEAGHALDSAYRLHFKRGWRERFGPFSRAYPKYYRPRPASRNFVLHLNGWYAQAHPAEDFAETFAVWLTAGSNWAEEYRDWPVALRKLQYVNDLMRHVQGAAPVVRTRKQVEPLRELRETLGEHYRRKRMHYGAAWPGVYDRDLHRTFSDDPHHASRTAAAAFLRDVRIELRGQVARGTGAHPYTIEQVVQRMIERCRELKLTVAIPRHKAKLQALVMLTVHTMNCVQGRRHEIPL